MTIEQKAKAYDEVIERAKKWHNAPNADKIPTLSTRVIEELFPELRESEDERIRGAIIDHLKDNNLTEWADWLEKQVEPKPTDEEMKELLRTEYEKGRADAIAEFQKEWSEEDEEYIQYINNLVSNCASRTTEKNVQNWLKDLKQRITNKQ